MMSLDRLAKEARAVQIRSRLISAFLTLLLAAALPLALASEAGEPGGESHEGSAGHHERKNEIALFLGLTDEAGHQTEFTYGLEYERRLTEAFGIGGLVDYVGGDLRNTVVALVFFWRPGGGWKFLAAPGIELHEGRGVVADEHHGEAVDRDDEHPLLRLGAAYDFHLGGGLSLSPALNLDLVNHERVWVYGLNLVYGW